MRLLGESLAQHHPSRGAMTHQRSADLSVVSCHSCYIDFCLDVCHAMFHFAQSRWSEVEKTYVFVCFGFYYLSVIFFL